MRVCARHVKRAIANETQLCKQILPFRKLANFVYDVPERRSTDLRTWKRTMNDFVLVEKCNHVRQQTIVGAKHAI